MKREKKLEAVAGLACTLMMCAMGAYLLAQWFVGGVS